LLYQNLLVQFVRIWNMTLAYFVILFDMD
jgi:hypothetical protein